MPLYTCTTPEGTLSTTERAVVAAEITRIHTTHTGAPASFVRVMFQTLPPDSMFSAGKAAKNVFITAIIRAGRSTEVKARILNDVWCMYKKVTGVADDQILIALTDMPPSNGMEFGGIVPEPGHEAEWSASRGLPNR
jgi:phenylpyruvate tautomerase PptA (4-oxalocrotonate tautomerase family)